jgi:hypothetical protein
MKGKYRIPLNEFGFPCRKDMLRLMILETKERSEQTHHLEEQQYTEWLMYYRPRLYRGPDPRGPNKPYPLRRGRSGRRTHNPDFGLRSPRRARQSFLIQGGRRGALP